VFIFVFTWQDHFLKGAVKIIKCPWLETHIDKTTQEIFCKKHLTCLISFKARIKKKGKKFQI
jgi:hypothetical protein